MRRQVRLQRRNLDGLAVSRSPPLANRGQGRDRRVHAGMQLRLTTGDHQRRALGIAGEEHVAAHRPGCDLRAAPTCIRTIRTPRARAQSEPAVRAAASAALERQRDPSSRISTSAARHKTLQQPPRRFIVGRRGRLLAAAQVSPRSAPGSVFRSPAREARNPPAARQGSPERQDPRATSSSRRRPGRELRSTTSNPSSDRALMSAVLSHQRPGICPPTWWRCGQATLFASTRCRPPTQQIHLALAEESFE